MRVLYVTAVIIIADQLTKFLVKGIDVPLLGIALQGMPLGASVPVFGDLLRITFIENPGMAFGIELGGKFLLTIFSIAASIGILFYIYMMRCEQLVFRVSLAFILGGAVGNLIDRVFYGVLYGTGPLFYGKVVDFIDVDFFNINFLNFHLSRFWVFNIADASVTVGVLMMLIFHRSLAKESERLPEAERETSSPTETSSTT
ncbi:MAG: signal peptidase II [Bacteroidota bacterium]|nr:signal peptidase II [Bacteroidota bacterium]